MKKIIYTVSLLGFYLFFSPIITHADNETVNNFSLKTTNTNTKIRSFSLSPEDQKKINPGSLNIKLLGPDGKEITEKTKETSGSSSYSVTVGAKPTVDTGGATTSIDSSRSSSLSLIAPGSETVKKDTDAPIKANPPVQPEKKNIKTISEPLVDISFSLITEEKKETALEIKPLPEIKKEETKKLSTPERERALQEYFENIQAEEVKHVLAENKKSVDIEKISTPSKPVQIKEKNTVPKIQKELPKKEVTKKKEIKKPAPKKISTKSQKTNKAKPTKTKK